MPCVTLFFLFFFYLCMTTVENDLIVKRGGTCIWPEMTGFYQDSMSRKVPASTLQLRGNYPD